MNRKLVIETVPCLKDNLSYLIVDIEQGEAIAIDPGEAAPFFRHIKQLEAHFLKPLELKAVLTTHHHHDHTDGLADLPEIPTWTSTRDQSRLPAAGGGLKRPQALLPTRSYSWKDLTGDGTTDTCFSVMEIPGHTEGQIAIRLQTVDDSHVFVGDTLFSLGCGRCLEGTPEELFASLQKITRLPVETRLHFGHEYTLRNFEFWSEMHRRHSAETKDIVDLGALCEPKRELEREISRDGFLHRKAPTLRDELLSNPFLKIKNATEFRRWRLERNQF